MELAGSNLLLNVTEDINVAIYKCHIVALSPRVEYTHFFQTQSLDHSWQAGETCIPITCLVEVGEASDTPITMTTRDTLNS